MISVSPEEKEQKLHEILAHLKETKGDEDWNLLEAFTRVVYAGLPEWMPRGISAADLAERIWDNFRFFVHELPPPTQLYRGLPGLHIVVRQPFLTRITDHFGKVGKSTRIYSERTVGEYTHQCLRWFV